MDDLPAEERREMLRLIVDQIAIDRDNSVTITLGIPTQGLVPIEKEESRTQSLNRHQKLRYSWAVVMEAAN